MKAVVVPVSGEITIQDLNTLQDIKGALDGGWLEALRLKDDAVAYIDEEGKLKGLPVNPRTMALAYSLNPNWTDFLVGPMVIFGTLNEQGQHDGDEHDVPQWVIDHFFVKDGQHQTRV